MIMPAMQLNATHKAKNPPQVNGAGRLQHSLKLSATCKTHPTRIFIGGRQSRVTLSGCELASYLKLTNNYRQS
jgi:hypothetical protein